MKVRREEIDQHLSKLIAERITNNYTIHTDVIIEEYAGRLSRSLDIHGNEQTRFISSITGKGYELLEGVSLNPNEGKSRSDIIYVMDWKTEDEPPVLVGWTFGASASDEDIINYVGGLVAAYEKGETNGL